MRRQGLSAKKGALWLGIARLVSIFLSFLSTMVLSRLLTPAEFGLTVPSTVVLALASALFDGALGISIVRRDEVDKRLAEEFMGAALMLGFAVSALLAITAPLLALAINLPHAAPLIAASGIVVLFRSAFVVLAACHQRARTFNWLAIGSVISIALGSTVVAIVLALIGFGAWSLTLGAIAGGVGEVAFLYFTLADRLRPRFGRAALRQLGVDEGAYLGTSLANWGALSAPTLIAAAIMGADQIGIYSRSQRVLEIAVSVLAGPLQRVLLPKFVSDRNDLAVVRNSFRTALDYMLTLTAILGTLAALHAKTAVSILLGGQWDAAVPVLGVLMIVLFARCSYKVTEAVSIALGSAKAVVLRQLVYLVLSVIGVAIGSRHGAIGVAIGTSFAVLAFYGTSLAYATSVTALRAPDVARLHGRALILCLWIVALNRVSVEAGASLGPIMREGLSMTVECMGMLAALLVFPDALRGPALGRVRSILIRTVNKLAPFTRASF